MLPLSKLLKLFLSVLFIFFFALSSFNSKYTVDFYTFIIFINAIVIYFYRNNITLLLVYIFVLFYTLALIPYYYYNVDVSPWRDFNELKYYNIVIHIHGLFLLIPLISKSITFKLEAWKFPNNNNTFGFYFFLTICILIIQFGVSGVNMFDGGGYAQGESYKSTMYEYFNLFFLLTYYYSSKKRLQIFLLIIIPLFYIYKSLIYGGRIEVIQLSILILFLIVSDFKFILSPSKLILGCFIFYYINIVFVGIRTNPLPLLEGKYLEYINPFNYYSFESEYISSNEGDVFQSSARLVGLIESDILNYFNRVKAFFGFCLSVFFPSSWLPEEASLITYKKDIYNSGGGGLISVYFYSFLSWIGPILISIYILIINKILKSSSSDYVKLYGLMAFSTFPRWFAYNPIILFKLCFWIIPISFTFNFLYRSLKPYKYNLN